MSRHLERLLEIDKLIRTTRRPTTASLAESLEISERTIRSDLAFLRDRFHAPLEYTPKLGHHYTEPEWRLPSVPLTQGELFALTVGAKMLETYTGSPYAMQLKSAIARLSERLPETTWVNVRQLAEEHIKWLRKINYKRERIYILIPKSYLMLLQQNFYQAINDDE